MAELCLSGLGVALVTPFKKDLTIDYQALEKLVEYVISGGCDYIVALGTTAETPTLSSEEKDKVARFISQQVGQRIPLVIGIGGNNTMGVIREIQSRDLSGYNAILSVTPYYNKPTQEGLFQHYKAISEVSPLPILLYNVPGRTGVNMTADTTLRLARLSKNICGIKEASGKLDQCEKIINNAPDHFSLVSGDDSATCRLMQLGAKGLISVLANAFPKETKKLVDLSKISNNPEAFSYQKSLEPLISHLFEDGNPAGVKAALANLGLLENVLRLPLVPVSKAVEEKLNIRISELFA